MLRRFAYVLSLSIAVALVVAACGDSQQQTPTTGTGGSAGSGGGGAGGDGTGGLVGSGGSTGCTGDADCDGGVCNAGTCCDSADHVCGDGCCADGEICQFESCVTPGDDCISAEDCPEDHYCEPALGEGGSGGMGQGGNCTQPVVPGKCLPLPPVCEGNDSDPENCIEPCEYHPPIGQLDATRKWQWGYDPIPSEFASHADVWATPAVGRVVDANCDGKVDLADPPNVVFVSGDSLGTYCCASNANGACRKGVLRVLDGSTGQEIWSLDAPEPGSQGFAGTSVAIGDVDLDQRVDIVALSGEGKVVIVGDDGVVKHVSEETVDGNGGNCFGWGGGIALGDMDGDGWPEIAYGASVFTMDGGNLSLLFHGSAGTGGNASRRLTHFADLDNDTDLELIAGRTAYHHDGSILWNNGSFNGFTATGDFDSDSQPEVVVVSGGSLRILEGATGATELDLPDIPGTGNGGPPTVADFDGDGAPEIGVAMQNLYSVVEPNYQNQSIDVVWSQTNHDLSSSVTGSSVFDFEGDGKAEVVYMDECFVWVYDGATGDVLYSTLTQSFTATEATIVADVDGDGHAEMVVVHNGADPSGSGWNCDVDPWNKPDPSLNRPAWEPPPNASDYRGITVYGDVENSWVGTRTLWNQHAYSVSNVCDPRDTACSMGAYYGQIPPQQEKNWAVPWLNNFRQNVQDGGLFDAPDVVVELQAPCTTPIPMTVSVRNIGLAGLPAGVEVGIYRLDSPDELLGTVTTTQPLLPGQTEALSFTAPSQASVNDTFQARVEIDPMNKTFNECREENNDSKEVTPACTQ